jgi:hypothetical protein
MPRRLVFFVLARYRGKKGDKLADEMTSDQARRSRGTEMTTKGVKPATEIEGAEARHR